MDAVSFVMEEESAALPAAQQWMAHQYCRFSSCLGHLLERLSAVPARKEWVRLAEDACRAGREQCWATQGRSGWFRRLAFSSQALKYVFPLHMLIFISQICD